ncbi:MAG: hypothetical protein AAF438_06780 [Pseudomonadota bacterium]
MGTNYTTAEMGVYAGIFAAAIVAIANRTFFEGAPLTAEEGLAFGSLIVFLIQRFGPEDSLLKRKKDT